MTVSASAGLSNPPVARSEAAPGRHRADETDAFRSLLDSRSSSKDETPGAAIRHGAHAAKAQPGTENASGHGRSRADGEPAVDRPGKTRGDRRRDADAGPASDAPLRDRLPLLMSLQHLSGTRQDQPAAAQDGDPKAEPAQPTAGPSVRSAAGRLEKHIDPAGIALAFEKGGHDGRGAPAEVKIAETSPPPTDRSGLPGRQRPSSHVPAEGRNGMIAQVATEAAVRPNQWSKEPRRPLPSDATAAAVTDTADGAEADATAQDGVGSAGRSIARDVVSGRSRDPALGEKRADRDAMSSPGGGHRSDDLPQTVTVTASQSFAAPASLPMSQTTAALVAAIGADNGFRQAAANAMLPGTVAAPAHLLRIELHPAELGSVIASLRLAGEQLSVEIKPENHEAYRRLSADAGEIRKSLDRLGLSVDNITVLQPQIAITAATRADMASSATAASGQNQASFQPGGSGNNGDGLSGQQSGRNHDDSRQGNPHGAPASRIRSGGDLFI